MKSEHFPLLTDWLRVCAAKREYERILLEAVSELVAEGTVEQAADGTWQLTDRAAQNTEDLLTVLERKIAQV